MKKWLACIISICLLFVFVSCDNGAKTENASSTTLSAETTITTEIQSNSGMVIDTEYYILKAPDSWNDDCFYKIVDGDSYNYTLSFYEKSSLEKEFGGWLFSIMLLTEFEDYTHYPNYEVLGSLEVYRIGCYNVVVLYPSDMQYSEETAEKYNEMNKFIPNVLNTISFKNECTFSEEPLEVMSTEPIIIEPVTQPQINKNFVGRWKGLGIGSKAPDGATLWNVEFRGNGTGTMEFIYEADDIVSVDFSYSYFETYLGESVDGIRIEVVGGQDIEFMTTYTWNNQMQKMWMTMYQVKNDGTLNLNIYWVFTSD